MTGILISFVIGTLFGMIALALICTGDLSDLYHEYYEQGYADGANSKNKAGAENECKGLPETVEETE